MTRYRALLYFAMIVVLLAACGPGPLPEVVEKEVTRIVAESVVATVIVAGTPQVIEREKIVTATPEPEQAPAVGGTLVFAQQVETTTLDPHLSETDGGPLREIGATLVAHAPDGRIVPYLAESWQISEDGLVWDFKLRKDVKFHNGAALTARDYVWTINRILAPETKALGARGALGPVTSAEAPDEYTLRLNLATPYYSLLYSLALSFLQPLSEAAVEAAGDQYGRNPVGTGPYRFQEWVTGDKIILERNPDFAWGPEFVHQGPAHINTVEYLFIPEAATILAGLEAGEIDSATVVARDVERLREGGQFRVIEGLSQGMYPGVFFNTSKPPFDDVRVRQAFNLAVDRDILVRAILSGAGAPQYGPISSSVIGYWPGVEFIGYPHDLERAKKLLEAAGYTYNDKNMAYKDGQPFKLQLMGSPGVTDVRVSEILQEEFGALGVEIEIVNLDAGAWLGAAVTGAYQLGVAGYNHSEADVLYIFFHSSNIGGYNIGQVADPVLDELLSQTRLETVPAKRQAAVDAAQRYIVEQAYALPLYTPYSYQVVSTRVQGDLHVVPPTRLYLNDAYIETAAK